MNSAVVLLVIAFAAVALGSFERRQKICGQVNDRCGMINGMQCCKGYTCQSYGLNGQRRCQFGSGIGGGVGGCINRGNTCSMMGNGRRCCMGSQCRRISGRSVCM
ncbi:hypothetical protein SNE40_012766 [Patella caerulea]|uniref:Uncharacterized protein n=1 Tax=Patella caerulea TaxID=87958 RepID=A0AAN8JI02_PATCE